MTVLLDTSRSQWDMAPAELGAGVSIGQLITPLTGYSWYGGEWAMDNGSFVRFDRKRFMAILRRQLPRRDQCLFVAVPDVVGNARRTLEVFDYWSPRLSGWPKALVAQNGQENLPIPWDRIEAIFIGGDDTFKDSQAAYDMLKAAHAMGKRCHVGRVNGEARVARLAEFSCKTGIDISIDGSGISQYSHMRVKLGEAIRQDESERSNLFANVA